MRKTLVKELCELCNSTELCHKLLNTEYKNQTDVNSPLVRLCIKNGE